MRNDPLEPLPKLLVGAWAARALRSGGRPPFDVEGAARGASGPQPSPADPQRPGAIRGLPPRSRSPAANLPTPPPARGRKYVRISVLHCCARDLAPLRGAASRRRGMHPCPSRTLFALCCAMILSGAGIAGAQTYLDVDHTGELRSLPHEMTPEEELIRDLIGADARITPPPSAQPVRAVAEFEHMAGVLVRYPLGISVSIVREIAEETLVYCIVTSGQQSSAQSAFQNGGVNMDNVVWFNAYTDSWWVRDYGPWFIYDADETPGVVDPIYNRPRPNDDEIPEEFASFLGWDLYQPDLLHTGGNWMVDGRETAASTDLVYSENPGKTPAEIDQIVEDYMGIQTYHVRPDVNGEYIEHIDCWGKFLTPDKIMIREVPTWHSQYDEIEEVVTYFANQTSAYGWPYEVVRVWTPGDEPYTNSLIINGKVLVPIEGGGHPDAEALAAYEAALPGFEVLGFTGSWYSTDALHCRTRGVADPEWLAVWSVPLQDAEYDGQPFGLTAHIVDYSQAGLIPDELRVYWRADESDPFDYVLLSDIGGDWYYGEIPAQPPETTIEYYVSAADYAGHQGHWPLVGPDGPFRFTVLGDPQDVPAAAAPVRLVLAGAQPNPVVDRPSTIRFSLSAPTQTALRIYDAQGRQVRELLSETLGAGQYAVRWDRSDDRRQPVSPGVYYYRLTGGGAVADGRILIAE
ncbi:MAG: T9SS type A sorting domain-containing protein [Candidatus Eisenbacteria bacterium]|nr:T9SS type A sorting domain-containing protein [Candidatus Eisenbacteria bacterium]